MVEGLCMVMARLVMGPRCAMAALVRRATAPPGQLTIIPAVRRTAASAVARRVAAAASEVVRMADHEEAAASAEADDGS